MQSKQSNLFTRLSVLLIGIACTTLNNYAHIKMRHFLSQGTIQARNNCYEHRQVRGACSSKFPLRAIQFQNTWDMTLTLTWNHYAVIRILPMVIQMLTLELLLQLFVLSFYVCIFTRLLFVTMVVSPVTVVLDAINIFINIILVP